MKSTLKGELNGPRDIMDRLACPFCREFGPWFRLVALMGAMTPYKHTLGWRHDPCGARLRAKEWDLIAADVHGYVARWWQPLVPSEDISDPAKAIDDIEIAIPA